MNTRYLDVMKQYEGPLKAVLKDLGLRVEDESIIDIFVKYLPNNHSFYIIDFKHIFENRFELSYSYGSKRGHTAHWEIQDGKAVFIRFLDQWIKD